MKLAFFPPTDVFLWTCTDSCKLPFLIWSLMCRLTGAKPATMQTDRSMDPIDIAHLWTQYKSQSYEKIHWILANMQDLVEYGFRPPTQNSRSNEVDTQLFLSIDLTSLHFQQDSKYRSSINQFKQVCLNPIHSLKFSFQKEYFSCKYARTPLSEIQV